MLHLPGVKCTQSSIQWRGTCEAIAHMAYISLQIDRDGKTNEGISDQKHYDRKHGAGHYYGHELNATSFIYFFSSNSFIIFTAFSFLGFRDKRFFIIKYS